MSLVSTGKNIIYNTSEYLKDKADDAKRAIKDRGNFTRNKVLSKPQTLEDFGIDSPTNKDLIEALNVLHSNTNNPLVIQQQTTKALTKTLKIYNPAITVQNISKKLIETLKRDNFPINVQKMLDLREEINAVQLSEKDINTQKKEIQNILNGLSSQEKLSISRYAHIIPFWITQIKDGNSVEKLTIPELRKKMPPHPGELPTKPEKEKFSSRSEYHDALSQWKKNKTERNKQYRKWNNRSCDTKFQDHSSKYFGDLGIRNRIPNFLTKIFTDISLSIIGKGQPDIVKSVFKPNIIELSDEDKGVLTDFIRGMQNGENYFIISNHETFANIPVGDLTIGEIAKQLGIDNINKHVSIGIGDLIECNREQDAVSNMLGHNIPTTPTTNNIPGDRVISKLRRENFADQVRRKLVPEENSNNPKRKLLNRRKKWGHAVICASSGTRDVIHRTNSGKPRIFIPDETQMSNRTTLPFIRKLAKKKVHIIIMATNTAEFKKPNPDNGVTANNNKWNPGATITIHFKNLDIDKLSNEEVINFLAQQITRAKPIYEEKKIYNPLDNSYTSYFTLKEYVEEPCGIKVPNDIFSYIKALTKDPEYSSTGHLPEELFIDEEEGKLNFELIRERIKEKEAQKKQSQNKG